MERLPPALIDHVLRFAQFHDVLQTLAVSTSVRDCLMHSPQGNIVNREKQCYLRRHTKLAVLEGVEHLPEVFRYISQGAGTQNAALAVAFTGIHSTVECALSRMGKAYLARIFRSRGDDEEQPCMEMRFGLQMTALEIELVDPASRCKVALPKGFYHDEAALRVEIVGEAELGIVIEGLEDECRFVILNLSSEKEALAWGLTRTQYLEHIDVFHKCPVRLEATGQRQCLQRSQVGLYSSSP